MLDKSPIEKRRQLDILAFCFNTTVEIAGDFHLSHYWNYALVSERAELVYS